MSWSYHRKLDDILHSWSITRRPGTVFSDFTDESAVLGRELVHEAGHHWLNDALSATSSTIPAEVTFHSPWRGTMRPVFEFLHACWAFPLT
jgi:HEXXH motif-containing protein